jgi:hypothetical protein
MCDAYFMPLREISVEHAVQLLVSGKASPVAILDGWAPVAKLGLAPSAQANWGARFQELIVDGAFLVPSAIRLHRPVGFRLTNVRPTRHMVFRRDRHACQYCGRRGELTLDHVMPQSRGGPDTWENLVSACQPCNQRKANRTPEEAGMKLAAKPRRYVPNQYMEGMAKLAGASA